MPKSNIVLLEHILESIDLIDEYINKKDEIYFLESIQFQDSIIRRIEIIGEAVKNISIHIKNEYPDIPWREIAGMRDMLIHEYFGVDLELTWKVATEDVQELREKLLNIKKSLIDKK